MKRRESMTSATIAWPFAFAIGPNIMTISLTSSPMFTDSRLNCILPRSIFERSRTSLISCKSVLPLDTIILRYCFASFSGTLPASRSSENPMMAFSGVRMSWETEEKK